MKKAALIIALAASLSAGAQQKKDSTVQITDSTCLMTVGDYQDFFKTVVQELPAKYADVIRQWWIDRIRQKIAALEKKK